MNSNDGGGTFSKIHIFYSTLNISFIPSSGKGKAKRRYAVSPLRGANLRSETISILFQESKC